MLPAPRSAGDASTQVDDRGVELTDRDSELAPGIALVADDDLPTVSACPFEQLDSDLALVALGRGEGKGPGSAIGREEAVQAKAPEEAGMRCAVAVAGGVGESRAACRLDPNGRTPEGWSR
jgi:hypothetical protein